MYEEPYIEPFYSRRNRNRQKRTEGRPICTSYKLQTSKRTRENKYDSSLDKSYNSSQ